MTQCKAEAKFKPGDRVKVVRLLDETTKKTILLIGHVGTVIEIEPLRNGEFDYYVADEATKVIGRYMHEAELEKAKR